MKEEHEIKTEHETWHCYCTCGSLEHQVHFDWWEECDEQPVRDMFMTIHLVDVPFWKRLKRGLAYIFGYKSRYGEFDEIVLGKEHAKAFHEIADKLDTMPETGVEQ